VKVNGEDKLLEAFAGEAKATERAAREYYDRACAAWLCGDTSEWYVTAWTEICFIGPDGMFERYVRPLS
jgi:hypothetical protein